MIIKGEPASGKSVVLRNVGYELANNGEKVYIIELKQEKPPREEIMKLENCYLFIDDVHLDPFFVEGITRDLKGVKIKHNRRHGP